MGDIQQINIAPVMPQLLKSDYFSSITVDTPENNDINYKNVLGIMEEACSSRSLQDNKTNSHSQVVY